MPSLSNIMIFTNQIGGSFLWVNGAIVSVTRKAPTAFTIIKEPFLSSTSKFIGINL